MSDLLRIGSSALNAAYVQLQTTGQNIANAGTPGYVRREVTLQETVSAGRSGMGGGGVDVVGVRRVYDAFLQREATVSGASSAQDAARSSGLSRLDQLFADSQSGLGAAFDELVSSFTDLSARPADASVRTAVLARVEGFAGRATSLDASLLDLRQATQQRMQGDVNQANDIMAALAAFNRQVGQSGGNASAPNNLFDQRDTLLADLNRIVRANATIAADGTVNVSTQRGEPLVVGDQAAQFGLMPDTLDATRVDLSLIRANGSSTRLEMADVGGTLAGMARFADTDIDAARMRLGQIVAGVVQGFNAQQASGLDATGATGQPFFAVGSPSVTGAAGNSGSAQLSASFADASRLQASDYAVAYDGSQYTVTRLSDGQASTFAGLPQTIDGLNIGLNAGSPAAGDRFLVRSASAVVPGLRALQSNPARIATASPITAQTGASNTGDLSVSALDVAPIGANTAAAVSITFTGAGTFDVTGLPGGPLTGLAFTPGMTLAFDGNTLVPNGSMPTANGWRMTLSGSPNTGDTLQLLPTANPAQDNRNARALQALGDAALVDGARVIDRFADLVGEVGTRSQAAQSAADMSDRLHGDALRARSDVSDVNLDEEAARLLQYQQAYQAAAKVVAAANEMFRTLLEATR
jgi:flagellar hook-associated protein 1 FlgK